MRGSALGLLIPFKDDIVGGGDTAVPSCWGRKSFRVWAQCCGERFLHGMSLQRRTPGYSSQVTLPWSSSISSMMVRIVVMGSTKSNSSFVKEWVAPLLTRI
jgi:hypothetical protein